MVLAAIEININVKIKSKDSLEVFSFSCDFKGTDQQLDDHLKECKYEAIKVSEFLLFSRISFCGYYILGLYLKKCNYHVLFS